MRVRVNSYGYTNDEFPQLQSEIEKGLKWYEFQLLRTEIIEVEDLTLYLMENNNNDIWRNAIYDKSGNLSGYHFACCPPPRSGVTEISYEILG